MKKFNFKKILKVFLFFILALIIFEGGLFLYYANINSALKSASELFRTNLGLMTEKEPCSFADTVGPHPYLTLYHPKFSKCEISSNNYGFKGPDIPIEKESDFYTILFIGASGAEQIAGLNVNSKTNYLEMYLNQNLHSPTKKPFKVLNVSMAGSHQPHVIFQAVMFAEIADHIISYDGFNYHWGATGDQLIESQIQVWQDAVSVTHSPFRYFVLSNLHNLKNIIFKSMFKNSYIFYWVLEKLQLFVNESTIDTYAKISPFPSVPTEWSKQKRIDFYFQRYFYYTKGTANFLQSLGKTFTTVIQPYPHEFKTLTDFEAKVTGKKETYESYPLVKKRMKQLSNQNIDVINLERIFSTTQETVYMDEIHLNTTGVQIASHEIAKGLAKKYNWKQKNKTDDMAN